MIKRWLRRLIEYLFYDFLLELRQINRRLQSIQILLKQRELEEIVKGQLKPLTPIEGIRIFPAE